MEEYIAATAPTFTIAKLPRNASPAQMMKQYNLKEQAVAQYPRRTLQWCLLNLLRRRCLMGQLIAGGSQTDFQLVSSNTSVPVATRSGRIVKRPAFLQDLLV